MRTMKLFVVLIVVAVASLLSVPVATAAPEGPQSVLTYTAPAKEKIDKETFDCKIASHKFDKATGVGTITFKGQLKEIRGSSNYYSFYGSAITNIVIPNSVTSIGDYAFYRCDSLTSITIPNSVTSIGRSAFVGCSSLKDITIPDSVTSIGEYVFAGCSSLTSITIPNSVTTFGDRAFSGCTGELIVNCNIPNSSDNYRYYEYHDERSYIGPFIGSKFTKVTIEDSVTWIGERAFYGCSSLTSITIPNSVTSIGYCAFCGCDALKDVNVNITHLAKYCTNNVIHELPGKKHLYIDNKEITELVIPNSVTSIGSRAFRDCRSLTSITIPDSVTSIGYEAFEGCYALKYVNVNITDLAKYCTNEDIHKIPGNKHFYIDNKEITELTIPDGVTSIGDYAFYGCSSLTSVTIPDCVTTIGDRAFSGCTGELIVNCNIPNTSYYYLKDRGPFIGSKFTKVTIGDGVTSIGSRAFEDCSSLTSVTILDSVISIGSGAFKGCSSLTSITIPDSVTSIGGGAFDGCSSLTDVIIPERWINIFVDCVSVETINGKKIITDGGFKFLGNTLVWVGRGLSSVSIPASVKSIASSAFVGCRGIKEVNVVDLNLWLRSGVDMSSSDGWSLYHNGKLVTNVTIPNGVTKIADGQFCRNQSLTSITIPNSVTTIGDYAFCGCSSLRSITIPASVTSIGYKAFYNCSRIGSITIPASVKEIGGNAFGPNYEGFLCVYMQGTTPPKLLGTFENNIKYYSDWQAKWWIANFGVFVPERALFDYRSADVWKEMADKIEPKN